MDASPIHTEPSIRSRSKNSILAPRSLSSAALYFVGWLIIGDRASLHLLYTSSVPLLRLLGHAQGHSSHPRDNLQRGCWLHPRCVGQCGARLLKQ
eukprot:7786994-Pyramimonas_sp.AAC.1